MSPMTFYFAPLLSILLLSVSRSAEITWQPPFNLTSADLLDTSGNLVRAVNATGDDDSPAVILAGEPISFEASPLGPNNTDTSNFFTGDGGDTGNSDLNTILNSHAYGTGAGWALQLTELTPGSRYQIQLIGAGDTRTCCADRNQRAGDNESPENISGDFSRKGVGSVIGTFTANATTQTINVLPGEANGADPGLSAYLLRSLTPGQPEPPSRLILNTLQFIPQAVSGTLLGLFSTTDPNGHNDHRYQLVPGEGSDDNQVFSITNGNELRNAVTLGDAGQQYTLRLRTTDNTGLFIEESFTLAVTKPSVRINEFLANRNGDTLTDEDGERSDWLELHNPDLVPVNLKGMFLSDDRDNLQKWSLPEVIVPGRGHLLIFASSKDRRPTNGDPLHTNFNLRAAGEYLALLAPDGSTILSEFGTADRDYPPQEPGTSYGFFGDPLQEGYLLNPTPGDENDASSGVSGFVADTRFSVRRGFYDTPFMLEITSATPEAVIRYTTDGSWPDETTGTIYTGPIMVDRTMAVKAMAYRPGFVPTNIDTHTYIIVDSVLTQTAANTRSDYGLPSSWGRQTPYYGMNNNNQVDPATHPTLADDLKTVPSLSIAIDADDMFGSSGIYSNPTSSGRAWERKTSLELVSPEGQETFQQNCAIRIQGGAFRSFGLTRKKSFRVLFKTQFGLRNETTGGPGTLDFPLFGTAPGVAQEFQTLVFRMESNDGWQWNGAGGQPQYARDEFGRRVHRALGQPAAQGRYLHLYLNGVYWGLYNVVERPDSGFAESYFEGAERELWEGQNSGSPINSSTNLNFWNNYGSVLSRISQAGTNAARDAAYLEACGFNPDGSRNPDFPIWCDPTNNADYFLTNWYGSNSDWPQKNYYGGIDTQPTRSGYKYFMWDAEWSLFLRANLNYDRIRDYRGIAGPNRHLQNSPEFRMRFADRTHRALFNEGPLTPEKARALYEKITAQHTSILNPEAARWGNQHGGNRSLRDWENEYHRIINSWFPNRGERLLASLRSAGLYPNLTAPTYSQHGGFVPSGNGPTVLVPQSVERIYYLYGTEDPDQSTYQHPLDPRLPGGEINPDAQLVPFSDGGPETTFLIERGDVWNYLDDGSDQGVAWRAPTFDDRAWKSGPSELGYGDFDEATRVGFVDTDPGQPGLQRNATTYFRKTLTIDEPEAFGDFTLNFRYDDGIVIFLNGVEVARENIGPDPAFDDFADGNSADNAEATRTLSPALFQNGLNTFAAEIHNSSAGSSDISFDLDLTGNPPGGPESKISDPILITEPGWLFSRSYDPVTGEWSALNSAFFAPDTIPAGSENLVISEFNYHPAEPVSEAEIAVSTNRDDYEFIELLNVGEQSIDLTGTRFTDGITFYFADHTLLSPGQRLVVVKDPEAFRARYGASIPIASDLLGNQGYGGRLSNAGEQITLLDASENPIHDFTYDDELPWPLADGSGFTMVLKAPSQPVPDHGLPTNWVASRTVGGGPGSPDEIGFTGVASADADHDGYDALLEYALGSDEQLAGDAAQRVSFGNQRLFVNGTFDDYLVIHFTRNLLAQNAVTLFPEISDDLVNWQGEPEVVLVSEVIQADNTAGMTYRSRLPRRESPQKFLRLRAVVDTP